MDIMQSNKADELRRTPNKRFKKESIKNLVTICVDHIFSNIDLYSLDSSLQYLPHHLKNRLLKRLTSVHVNILDVEPIIRMLANPQLTLMDFSLMNLDDKLFRAISCCYGLEKLILSLDHNNELSESAMVEVIPNFTKLKILQATNCTGMTDSVIYLIVQNCPNLTGIDLTGCYNITENSLVELSKLNLTAVNVSTTPITDSGLEALATGNSRSTLKELRIAKCYNITSECVGFVYKHCPSLEVFVFNDCGKMKISDINHLFAREIAQFGKIKQMTWTIDWE